MYDEQSMMPIAATRREVAAQPEVVARVLAEQSTAIRDLAQRLAARATRQIVLLGSGDSWFAGLGCRLAFETYSVRVRRLRPRWLRRRHGRDRDQLKRPADDYLGCA